MSQPLLTEAPEKAKQRTERREPYPNSTRSFQGRSNPILQLQRTLGNQRVAQLIKTKRLTPEGRIIGLQSKLTVGAADDQYEQEADRVARQVVSMPDSVAMASLQQAPHVEGEAGAAPGLQSKPLPLAASITPFVQRKTEPGELKVEEEKDKEDEKDELLRARFLDKSAALPFQRLTVEEEEPEAAPAKSPESLTGSFEAGDEVESQLSQSKGQGSPLPDQVRSYMEPRFGVDFGQVRVHTGSNAIQMARDIGAQAFTHGSDIYYGAGSSPTNFELTAHELTHVMQQTGAMPLQAKRNTESSPQHPALPIQRICKAYKEEDKSLRRNPIRMLSYQNTKIPEQNTAMHAQRISKAAVSLQRYSWDEFENDVESVGEATEEGVEALGEAVVSGAETVGEAAISGVETVVEGAEAVGEAIVSGAETVGEAASETVDLLATEAGQLATSLARGLGGEVSLTSQGLVVTIPGVCPLDATLFSFELASMEREFMVPIAVLPLGPTVAITGQIGLVGRLQPIAQLQVGPFCLNGARILINPLTNSFSISGSVSATVAGSLSAEVRGGLRGALSIVGIVPIGGIPVPIEVPVAGLEGGLAGLMRGTAASTLTIGGGLSFSGGVISMNQSRQLDLGLASDLFLGAYAQLDIEGKNVCRLYWQPLEWQGEIAGSLDIALGLTIEPGSLPSITPTVSPPTFTQIPFDQIPLALSRDGFSDACPIKDKICQVLETLNLLPSQNEGTWADLYPNGPGVPLGGPFPVPVYPTNLNIPSRAECRGACGTNCVTCAPTATYRYTDPITGDIWEYSNFQDCNTNEGCREHDAAYDWAAKHGEIGDSAIIMPWHMAANIECGCKNLGGNCIAWIVGLPPYDGKMYFADTATLVSTGGGISIGPTHGGPDPDPERCNPLNSGAEPILTEGDSEHGRTHIHQRHAYGTGEANSWFLENGTTMSALSMLLKDALPLVRGQWKSSEDRRIGGLFHCVATSDFGKQVGWEVRNRRTNPPNVRELHKLFIIVRSADLEVDSMFPTKI